MNPITTVWNFLQELVPPDDSKGLRAWRVKIAVAIWLLIVITLTHLAAAKGMLGFMGIDSVAYASDVKRVEQQGQNILRAIYMPQIRELVRERCEEPDPRRKEALNRLLDNLREDYERTVGEKLERLPSCDEV